MCYRFLGNPPAEFGIHQSCHGRVDLKLLSKYLPHLPQQPGSHGQEGRGVVLVLRLSLFHVQLHRRPYHCVADWLEVRVFREGYPTYGPLIVHIPGGLLVLIPQIVELGEVLVPCKLIHDLVHKGLEFGPQIATHLLPLPF